MISNISLITMTVYVKPCSVFQPFCFFGNFVCWLLYRIVWGLSDEKQIGARLEKEIEMYCSNKALERLKDIVARDSHRIAITMGPKTILKSNWIIFVILRFFQALDLCRTQCKELRRYFFQIKRLSRFFSIC